MLCVLFVTVYQRIGSSLQPCHHYVKPLLRARVSFHQVQLHEREGVSWNVSWSVTALPSSETNENRPLTERGKKRLRQAASGLVALDCRPTHLLTSQFVRAYDTAKLLRTVVCPTVKVETGEKLAVGAKPEHFMTVLQALPSDAVALCVGHEPLLGELVALLLCGHTLPNFPLKKAEAVFIEAEGKLKPGHCRLGWWFPPMRLRMLGKRVRVSRQDERC